MSPRLPPHRPSRRIVKDVDRLVRAYDDSAGVTAAVNKNVLEVLARELDADLDRALDLEWRLAQGEEVLTGPARSSGSRSCRPNAAAGFSVEQVWTDPAEDFALLLAQRVG